MTCTLHPGAWAPSVVVELVTRFARRLSQDVAWPEIQELLVLINEVPIHKFMQSSAYVYTRPPVLKHKGRQMLPVFRILSLEILIVLCG